MGVSLRRGSLGNLGVHLLGTLRDGERRLRIWCISLCGSSVRGTWRGGSFAGDPEGYGEEGLGEGHLFSPWGPRWGAWRGARLPGTYGWGGLWRRASLPIGAPLERMEGSIQRELWEIVEGGLWKQSFSLYGRSVRGTWRGLLYWGPWRLCRGRLWWRASLSIGSPLGNLEGGSFTGDFERWM